MEKSTRGTVTAHQTGLIVEERLQRARRVCLGVPSLAAAALARELGLGVDGSLTWIKGY